jgi:4-alpha-glucanotransferase
LVAILQKLGASIITPQDAPTALREKRQRMWRRPLEPVTIAWDGDIADLPVRLPRDLADTPWECTLTLEDGQQQTWKCSGADLLPLEGGDIEGVKYVVKALPLNQKLVWGYHQFALEIPGLSQVDTLLISAPAQAYNPSAEGLGPTWGVFLPLYALRQQKSTGSSGNFSDLRAMTKWVSKLGGGIVATLPLLASFLDEPFEPSPYAPASRLLWNEFYLDLSRATELRHCPAARAILDSAPFREEIDQLRKSPLIDYRRGMRLKRKVLEKLAQCCFEGLSSRLDDLEHFLAQHPAVEDYASFRATTEKQGKAWHLWPQRLRDGHLREGDYEEEAKRYHLYAQWMAHEQIMELSREGRVDGVNLYLDLPLGVHPDGYDVWRRQDLFVKDITVGAPPDAFFTQGQNWGFPPVHPEHLRQSGYGYFRAYLRHHLGTAGILRIDHVMGLHRLFWTPHGMGADKGLYVRYPAEEFYAVLALESHNYKATIVGEDLGTVPPEVRPAMRRRGLHGMYVTYFGMSARPKQALARVPSNALASVNTHDLPPFSGFWQGLDIDHSRKMGHQSEAEARQGLERRETFKESLINFLRDQKFLGAGPQDQRTVLKAILSWLGSSPAPMVLVNLEDLWLETAPQNIPGTGPEQSNWQRKARYSFEEFSQMPQVMKVLRELNSQRGVAAVRR